MTSVEECTRAETGVGAAIAAGSHAENGIWALLVMAAPMTRRERRLVVESVLSQNRKLNSPQLAK